MTDSEATHIAAAAKLPSVDHSKPDEEGGPAARTGFNYQDEIAVSFLIEMLETPSLIKVHCETHDDIVLVRIPDNAPERIAEFVQVKASEADKLWSIADVCKRKNGKSGTSIFEKSLARDKHEEQSVFRLVTIRPVASELKILTFAYGTAGRSPDCEDFLALQGELDKRFPKHASPKGNGIGFWLSNCLWDQRHSEQSVRDSNLLRLIKLSSREGAPILPEQAEQLLDELRATAKKAGDAKWDPDREKKIIVRHVLRSWWKTRIQQLTEGVAATSGDKLVAKMSEASLPQDLIRLAVDMRQAYSAISRAPRYLESDEGARLQNRVKSEVMSLRARLVAGQINLDGAGFHALCVERMDAIAGESKLSGDHAAYLKGCMYDIADRCMLRFVRPQ